MSSANSSSKSKTSSTWKVFQAARSKSFGPYADLIMTSSSNTIGPKHDRRSVAICLLAENNRSHRTEDACASNTSNAISASVRYNCSWFYQLQLVDITVKICRYCLPATIQQGPCPFWHLVAWYWDIGAVLKPNLPRLCQPTEVFRDACRNRIKWDLPLV